MNKWVTLQSLPNDFWGECFVGWSTGENYGVDPNIVMLRNFDGNVQWWCDSLKEWFDFRHDVRYRVMIIEYPKINQEAFK